MAESGGDTGKAEPEHYKLASTPPMGWNSFQCYTYGVTEAQVKENADYMAEHLKKYGWEYVVIDYVWSSPLVGQGYARDQDKSFSPRLSMDQYGRLLPETNRFPSAANGQGYKPLADYIHGKGLKFGIHLMRGIPRQAVAANTPILDSDAKAADAADAQSQCKWCNHMVGLNMKNPAGQAYLNSLFKLYASWGVDFVKVDDLSFPYHEAEVEGYRKAIDQCGRPMVFSTSPGATPLAAAEHVKVNANMWRVMPDLWDKWKDVKNALNLAEAWSKHAGPGHWPDLDMLPMGKLVKYGPPGAERYSRLTRDERCTLMSLWLIARSPLMLGGNQPENDEFTTTLITNEEALEVNKKAVSSSQLFKKDGLIAWVANVQGSTDKYVALFNTTDRVLREVYRSPLVTRETPGQAVDIDVEVIGPAKLILIASDGDDGGVNDHADWAEPRLTGPRGEGKLTDVKWLHALNAYGPPLCNKSMSGGDLIIGGRKAEYGIGTRANAKIEYDVPEGYTRFKVHAGLDKGAVEKKTGGATVKFIVCVEDKDCPSFRGNEVKLSFKDIGLEGECKVRDLWKKSDVGNFKNEFSARIPCHGAGLYKLTQKP